MSNRRVSDLTLLAGASIAQSDILYIVDVSAAEGSRGKKTTVADLALAITTGSYQPASVKLDSIAALVYAGNELKNVRVNAAGTGFELAATASGFDGLFGSLTSVPTTLAGYGITDAQAKDLTLTNLAAQNWALNSVPVGTGVDTVSQLALTTNTVLGRSSTGNVAGKTVTDFAFGLLNNADAAGMRTTLGVDPAGSSTLTAADETSDTTCFPMFTTSATGTVTLKTNSALTFNSTTANLGCTTFTGALVGNASTATLASAATVLATPRTIGGVSFDGSANITVATATGGFTVSGGNLALGANSLTMTGSIGSTGSRVTKLWATDIASTNAIAADIAGNAATVTVADAADDTTCWIALARSQTGNQAICTDAEITYNASTGILAVNISGSSTSTTGNAATATALATVRTIGGSNFDGSANVTSFPSPGAIGGTIPAAGTFTTLTGTSGSITGLTALAIRDTSAAFDLTIAGASSTVLTAGRTLTLDLVNAARTLKLTGNPTLADWFDQSVKTGASPTFVTVTAALTGNASTATALQNARTIGGVSFDGTANITVSTATAGFTVSGGNLALGANSLTMTGSIASTGSRVTKVWATDAEFTNAPSVNGVAASGSGAIALVGSPALSGSPTAPTQTPGDNSTKIATTGYVDTAVLGQNFKEAAKYATTAALPTVVYSNGSSGVGATLTGVALGALSIDSNTPSVGDRVLIKNQVSTFQNGFYTVTTVGSGAAVFVLTRATDGNQSFEWKTGDSALVTSGTLLTSTTWAYNGADSPTMGTDAITFAQTAGPGTITSGNGITVTGLSIAIDTSVTVDKTTVQTLTNKTISGASNTLTVRIADITASTSAALGVGSVELGHATDTTVSRSAAGKIAVEGKAVPLASGTDDIVFTTSGATGVTLPTSGTLATLAGTETFSGKTLTTPKIADGGSINDANGNEYVKFAQTASAVNEITITNGATTGFPTITASGSDSVVSFLLVGKGGGTVYVADSADNTKKVGFLLSGATTGVTTSLTFANTLSRTVTYPDASGTVVYKDTTDTLTNKTMIATSNVVEEITSTTSSATPTPTGGSLRNFYFLTAQAATGAFAAPSGSPVNGNFLTIRIKASGTQTLSWNAIYRAAGGTPPTSLTDTKTIYLTFRYNSADSKWDCLAVTPEF